ncbi:MAG: hypothetical protein FWB86_14530 [Treponema sp.]|nr:hypothetical protein [Treponema sp.]
MIIRKVFDNYSGKGKQTYTDGRIYEGGFYYDTHDQPVGEGTITYPDGRIVKGRWKNCKFTEKERNG